MKGSYADPDAATDGLVASDDGMFRLPAGIGGQLPLFFSLKASKPAVRRQ